jgi:hypothetical protein
MIVKIQSPKTKADKLFNLFPRCLYKVTKDFGYSNKNEIREAILINSDGTSALLYHPSSIEKKEKLTGSFEICIYNGKYWVSKDKYSFVNYNSDSFASINVEYVKPPQDIKPHVVVDAK